MKQLTPEILRATAEKLGIKPDMLNEDNWEWQSYLVQIIEELCGEEYISYGAEINSGQDYSDIQLYVGTTMPTIGWVSITFNHDFNPMEEADIIWTELCEDLLYQEERAKKVKVYFLVQEKTKCPPPLN